MSNKELQDLLKLINRLELSEFKMKEGDFSLSIRTKYFIPSKGSGGVISQLPAPVAAMPVAAAALETPKPQVETTATDAAGSTTEHTEDESKYLAVKSPMVGTFYRSPSPDKPIYVKIGDTISAGDTVCIIEAMKLFNEVEAEVTGKIVKVLVEDAQPVEYDQVLFLVDPSA